MKGATPLAVRRRSADRLRRRLRQAGPALLAVLLAAAACAPPPPVQRPGWSAASGAAAIEALLAGDAAAVGALPELTAEVRFDLHREGAAGGAVLYRAPDLMRVDVRGPLFQHLLTAVVQGERMRVKADNRTWDLPARRGLDAFLGIDLGGYDPRLIVLGLVAPSPVRPDDVRYPRADRAVVDLHDPGGAAPRRLWIDLHRGFVEREILFDGSGGVRWTRRLSGYRALPGTAAWLPRHIRLEGDGHVLQIDYKGERLGTELSADDFFGGIGRPGPVDTGVAAPPP